MSVERKLSWPFWVRWVAASFLGLLTGLVLFVVVGIFAGEAVDRAPDVLFGVVLGLVFGAGFGFFQARVLREHIEAASRWIGATVAGFLVGSTVVFGLLRGADEDSTLWLKLSHALVVGAALGVAQALALGLDFRTGVSWTVIVEACWLVAELVAAAGSGLPAPLDLIALFLVASALPGVWLPRLLDRDRQGPH